MLKKSKFKKHFLSAVLSLCFSLPTQIALATTTLSSPLKLTPTKIQALNESQLYNLHEFKLQPRFNVWGFTGDSTLTEGQFLAPLYGDQTRALYVAFEGNYVKNDSSWLTGAGLGYRQIVNNRIYGGYALADYVSTPHNGFAIINPGVEMLGNVWDININGYIPLDNKKKLGEAGWAGDDFGDYSHVINTGHDVYDHWLQQYEEPARGVDFEIGREIPYFENAKLYLGAYHFDTSDAGSTNGIETRLTYDLNKYSAIELENNYDNTKHNQFIIGIRFNLGNYNKEEKQRYGIATRLLDPIEHDEAVLHTSSTTPMHKATIDQGEQQEHDNVWYFKPASEEPGTSNAQEGDGTAENPFVGFTYDNYAAIDRTIGTINPYPLMYFSPGTYSLTSFSSRGIDDRFNLPNGWGMYGRTSGYAAPATGNDRASFIGGLDMYYNAGEGAEATTLNSIRVINIAGATTSSDYSNAALYTTNAANVILQNSDLNNTVIILTGDAYAYGVYANSSTINFTGGTNNITAATFTSGNSTGIYADHSYINFTGGTNTIQASGVSDASSYGIDANSSFVNFLAGTNTVNASTTTGASNGIYANFSNINLMGGTNTVDTSANSGSSTGFYVNYTFINFIGGTNTVDALTNNGSSTSIYAENANINFYSSLTQKVIISATGNESDSVYGIYADNSSHIRYDGSDLPTETAYIDIQDYITLSHAGTGTGKGIYGGINNLDIDWP